MRRWRFENEDLTNKGYLFIQINLNNLNCSQMFSELRSFSYNQMKEVDIRDE